MENCRIHLLVAVIICELMMILHINCVVKTVVVKLTADC